MPLKPPHPDKFDLDWSRDPQLERIIEARAAIRAEAAALRWRFRLILIETLLISTLVLAAGLVLKHPIGMVLRGAALVGGACLVSGLLLIGLSGLGEHVLARYRRWRRS